MSDPSRQARDQVDIYLAALRKQLAGLPADDVEEILRELHGHIAERGVGSASGRERASGRPAARALHQ